MTFEINGKMEKFYGTLAVISADNLGSLGGFKESCSAYRCCRHCMATQETARTLVKLSGIYLYVHIMVSLYSLRIVSSLLEISLHTSTNVYFSVVKFQFQYRRRMELTEMPY